MMLAVVMMATVHMFIGGMLDSPTHNALTSRSQTVLTRQ